MGTQKKKRRRKRNILSYFKNNLRFLIKVLKTLERNFGFFEFFVTILKKFLFFSRTFKVFLFILIFSKISIFFKPHEKEDNEKFTVSGLKFHKKKSSFSHIILVEFKKWMIFLYFLSLFTLNFKLSKFFSYFIVKKNKEIQITRINITEIQEFSMEIWVFVKHFNNFSEFPFEFFDFSSGNFTFSLNFLP